MEAETYIHNLEQTFTEIIRSI